MINLLVDLLATYRITRLVIEDEITAELRTYLLDLLERLRKTHPLLSAKLEYLLGCPWCVSVWAGLFVFGLRRALPGTASVLSGALAASLVTGVLSVNEDKFI